MRGDVDKGLTWAHAGSLTGIQRSADAFVALLAGLAKYKVERVEGGEQPAGWLVQSLPCGWEAAFVVISETPRGLVADFYDRVRQDLGYLGPVADVTVRLVRKPETNMPVTAIESTVHGRQRLPQGLARMVLRDVEEVLGQAAMEPAPEPGAPKETTKVLPSEVDRPSPAPGAQAVRETAQSGPGRGPARRRRSGTRALFSPEGQKRLVCDYWEARSHGLAADGSDYYDDPRDKRLTQEEWAEERGLSSRTLRRYIAAYPDLKPPDG